ncbi:hypothetical protein [Sorangium sp. So ce854]|uniref:hypothetical protein n=1 Tax=Sorangium sp. So ce854 TaxID=3133322 RepID=UPI003F5EE92B
MPPAASPNFAFLDHHDPRLVVLGTQAERYFADDPNTCLVKLRQFGEILAQRAAAPLTTGMSLRTEIDGEIDADRATSLSEEITEEVANRMDYYLPQEAFCDTFRGSIRPPERVAPPVAGRGRPGVLGPRLAH